MAAWLLWMVVALQSTRGNCLRSALRSSLSWKAAAFRAMATQLVPCLLVELDPNLLDFAALMLCLDVLHGAARSVHQAVLHVDVVPQRHSSAYGHLQKGLQTARVFWLGTKRAVVQLRSRTFQVLLDVALVVLRHGFASGVEVHGAWRWLLPAVPLYHEVGERAEVCVCPLADPHPRQERCLLRVSGRSLVALELADFEKAPERAGEGRQAAGRRKLVEVAGEDHVEPSKRHVGYFPRKA